MRILLKTGALTGFILLLSGQSAGANDPNSSLLSVMELLDRYAAVQDRLDSYIMKGQTALKAGGTGPNGKTKSTEQYTRFELRTDGTRIRLNKAWWGRIGTKVTPEENPLYISERWTGKLYLRYTFQEGNKFFPHGELNISDGREMSRFDQWCEGHEARGYYYGIGKRIDHFLRDNIEHCRCTRMEKTGQVLCPVIEADTASGQIRLWIDPQHGYQIARAAIQMKEGDLYVPGDGNGNLLKKGDLFGFALRDVEFDTMSGLWFPSKMEVTCRIRSFQTEGHSNTDQKTIEISGIQLDPDHKKLKSFAIDDIRDSARVLSYLNRKKPNGGLEQFTWEKNRIFDSRGNQVASFEELASGGL